jgi:hypothetical protein
MKAEKKTDGKRFRVKTTTVAKAQPPAKGGVAKAGRLGSLAALVAGAVAMVAKRRAKSDADSRVDLTAVPPSPMPAQPAVETTSPVSVDTTLDTTTIDSTTGNRPI